MISNTLPQQQPRRTLRSIGAVFAGLFFIFLTSSVVDAILHATGIFPPIDAPPMSNGLFALAFAYRTVFDVAGCVLTAKLAPSRPLFHAMVLGGIGTVLSIAGAIAMWDAGTHWYPVLLALSALPCAYVGARLVRP
ncbi:MAG: hypothetical protein QM817_00475 [Archangium sp.]